MSTNPSLLTHFFHSGTSFSKLVRIYPAYTVPAVTFFTYDDSSCEFIGVNFVPSS